jgi:phage terminase Nu1 subunit (DNA packaging protein)
VSKQVPTYSLRQLSDMFGKSERTLRAWLEGLEPAVRGGRGVAHQYYLEDVCRWRFGAASRGASEQLDGPHEKARVDKERADKLEMENAILRGDSLPAAEVEAEWVDAFTQIKTLILAAPRKAAPLVVGMSSMPEIEAVLNDILRDSLIRAAGDGDGEALIDAAAEPDGESVGGLEETA